jgi:hypothetical protein
MNFDLKSKKWIIGMVHIGALPGTPGNHFSVDELLRQVEKEVAVYSEEGVDAIMLENMHDRPYMNRKVGPEIVASMTRICAEIRKETELMLGLQILAGANKEALAVAYACNFNFIRAEGFVFGHLADEGMMNSDAGELLRYRKMIGAENVNVFTDIKKKHSSHVLTHDISIVETAKAAEFFLSNGIIITGKSTGFPAKLEDVKAVKQNTSLPMIIGSGIDYNNLEIFWEHADAFIIGSSFKYKGNWENEVERQRVKKFMDCVNKLKE